MTYEEAIKEIKNMLIAAKHDCDGLNSEYENRTVEALTLAYEALKKQLPMKSRKNKSYVRFCPKCEAVLTASYKYCDECGQRLDWSEVKD